MRLIEAISAEEFALLLSKWGYQPSVEWQINKAARLRIGHEGLSSFVYMYGLDESGRCRALTFSATDRTPIQFWHLEKWSRSTLFGRLRRNDEGHAEVDWVLPIEGVTEDYLRYSFDIWRGILINFLKFCIEVEDKNEGS